MGKNKYSITDRKIEKRLKEGRGKGKGALYMPWLTVFDLPSTGRSHRIPGLKTQRIHHLLSDLEAYELYRNDFADQVLEIREQYPLLPREETIEIAKEIGVQHPMARPANCQIVMTTDQLLTVSHLGGEKYEAISVKYSKELNKPRVLEKLEIEKHYWERRNIIWKLVTEKDINKAEVDNLRWFRPYFHRQALYPLTNQIIAEVSNELTQRVLNEPKPLSTTARLCDERYSLKIGSSLAIARHLLANKKWIVNLKTRVHPRHCITLLETNLPGIAQKEIA
jgi:TnsA endonuclease N terminal/TnsA endonuclease C terminal